MYTEFIVIFIGLGILFVMLAAIIVLLIILLRKSKQSVSVSRNRQRNLVQNFSSMAETGNVVFCKRCAAQFSASEHCCPKCGALR